MKGRAYKMQEGCNNLYEFITATAKEKNVRIEALPKLCDYSRSTIYRYMKGITPMNGDAEERFAVALTLDGPERKLFRELILRARTDESMLEARKLLDAFAFSSYALPPVQPIQFVYYDNEKYLRSGEELTHTILAHANESDFACSALIFHCIGKRILPHTLKLLKHMLQNIPNFTAEHMVSVVERDYAQNIELFIQLITLFPLSEMHDYSVYINEETVLDNNTLFNNSILLETTYGSEQTFYWITLSEENSLSNCIAFRDRYMYSFIKGGYQELKDKHCRKLFDMRSIDLYSNDILEFEQCGENYLVKPDLCFNMIPQASFTSMINRSRDSLKPLIDVIAPGKTLEEAEIIYQEYFKARTAITYTQKRKDIFCVSGLRRFVKTGKIIDHLNQLPAFNKEEVRLALEYLRDRNNDENDPYEMYVSQKQFAHDDLLLMISKSGSIMVEYNQDHYSNGLYDNIHLDSSALSEILIDYIDNHFIPNHTMPKEEVTAFINELINEIEL